MIRKLFVFSLIIFISSGCLLHDEEYDVFAEDYDTLSWDFQNTNILEVSAVNGDISVYPNNRKTLDAVFYRRCWGTSLEDAEAHLKDIRLVESISGTTFSLDAEIPGEDRNYVASFNFEAPDSIFIYFFIINGYLLAEKVASDLKFRAQTGSLETKLVTGNIDLEIITGGVSVQDHEGDVRVVTSTGQVYCSMYEIHLDQNIDIQTGIGGVTLEVPSDASFTFEISTTVGKMYLTGFDDISYEREELYYRSGEVNGGEANIHIRCTSGSINIKAFER